jgi:hypothetical protein
MSCTEAPPPHNPAAKPTEAEMVAYCKSTIQHMARFYQAAVMHGTPSVALTKMADTISQLILSSDEGVVLVIGGKKKTDENK